MDNSGPRASHIVVLPYFCSRNEGFWYFESPLEQRMGVEGFQEGLNTEQ
jgi:hypothetical protein